MFSLGPLCRATTFTLLHISSPLLEVETLLGRDSNHVFLCSQLDAGERALVRGMRTQVERMILRHPEGCDEVEEEEEDGEKEF